ncbi:hypothetical protein [Amycolatopsis silviterrae]|uniref:Peptidase inhibitor family I36 protein n=1 Tax=Amycolatopsis silviterrae TaxID=1656914 RepID=A0ABW5H9I0_9PSEU
MINRFRKVLASLAMAAAMAGTLATPAQASTESGGFWDFVCHAGRACIRLAHHAPSQPEWWNLDGCDGHPIRDYYDAAIAHGNSFRVIYWDYKWDDTAAWTSRLLDSRKTITTAWVWC